MKKSSDITRPSKACILTFGCQMNVHDSERMGAVLEQNGFTMSTSAEDSELVILNTCSVREKPEEKVSSMLDHMRGLKNKKPSLIVAVAGCVAQQKGEEIVRSFPFVDVVIGPDGIDKLIKYINDVKLKSTKMVDTDFIEEISYSHTLVTREGATKAHAYVTAMKGCNNFCSYCIVPYVRGRERSRTIAEVRDDIQALVSQGITSITLLGQNIARFGLENKEDLPKLLRAAGAVNGIKRLTYFTSHPRDFNDEMIRCYDEIEVLAPMIHLPAQHGSNKILKAMNRGYTREQYLSVINKLRTLRVWNDLAITTDVILGFPGEDENDFDDLMSLLNEVQYDNSFSFIYSPRPGTKAYEQYGESMDPKLRSVYTDRLMRYQKVQKVIALEKNKKLLGRTIEVLVEGASEKDPNRLSSRTSTGKVVNFDASQKQTIETGSYVMVKIVKVHPTHLKGELSND
jgi:tRNA-2-methylthio-N6-dimethylallyladenosine synthase